MKREPRSPLLLTVSLALAAALLSGCSSADPAAEIPWDELERSGSYETRLLAYEEDGPFILQGDLIGGSGGEMVLPIDSGWAVLNEAGEEQLLLPGDPRRWKPIALADWDGDGKDDLLLGEAEPPGVSLQVISGAGRVLFEGTVASEGEAVLQAGRVDDGLFLFVAYPPNRGAPRMIGAMPVGGCGERCDQVTIGPLPLGISEPVEEGGARRYGVTLRGGRQGTDGYLPEVAGEPDQLCQLLLRVENPRDPELSVEVGPQIGPPVRHGFPRDAQISRLEQLLCPPPEERRQAVAAPGPGDNAGARVLLLKERLSPVYGGSSDVELRDLDGELLARLEGPEATRGQLRRVTVNGERRLLLVWSRTGEVLLLTEELEVLSRRALAPEGQQLCLQRSQGAEPPFLLSAGSTAWVLDGALQTLWAGDARRVVRDGGLTFSGRKDATVTLIAAGAERFSTAGDASRPSDPESALGEAESAGPRSPAAVTSDPGNPAAWPGGSIRLTDGRLQIEPAEGFRYYRSAHFDDDGRLDHFFLHKNGDRFFIYGSSGTELGRGYMPRALRLPSFVGDLDGDGAAEMLGTFSEDADRGALLFSPMAPEAEEQKWSRFLSFGYDSGLILLSRIEELILLRMVSGYMLAPRGAYGIEAATGEMRFFRPSGGFTFAAHLGPEGAIYFDTATPTNGNVVRQEEGFLDVDAYVYRHIIDQEGNPTAAAGPLPDGLGQGGGRYFFFDSEGDGVAEPYLSIQKDPDFYPGTGKVLRIHPDGETEVVYTGPEDSYNFWYPLTYQGERLLFGRFRQAGEIRQVSPDFEELRSWDIRELRGGPVAQLRNGGPPHLFHLRDRGVVAWNLISGEERLFRIRGEEVKGYRILENRDGSRELVLLGESSVEAFIP